MKLILFKILLISSCRSINGKVCLGWIVLGVIFYIYVNTQKTQICWKYCDNFIKYIILRKRNFVKYWPNPQLWWKKADYFSRNLLTSKLRESIGYQHQTSVSYIVISAQNNLFMYIGTIVGIDWLRFFFRLFNLL